MTIAPEFEDFVAQLEREAAEGFFHTGAQVAVVADGELVLDAAVGTTHRDEPITTESLFALYCTAKPVLAAAALRLIADDELSLDDCLGDVVEPSLPAWMAERTIEQVLAHTAGLHAPQAVASRVIPERDRLDWLRSFEAPPGWRFGVDRSYSEWAGWYLLGLAVEGAAEQPFDEYAARQVVSGYLEPAGVPVDDLTLRIPTDRGDQLARVAVTYDLAGPHPVPLLAEAGAQTAAEWNPSFGAYGTMSALVELYAGLLADLDGAELVLPQDLLEFAVASRLPLTDDVTLGRPVAFGLGVMTTLSSHHFGDRVSDRAFGHAGQGGSCFAFADPARDVAVALLCNAGLDADTALGFRRAALTDAILRVVDER
ncbi:MAG: serine hydrolase domain-containing protein [Actinomycetes bacterium]